MSYFNPDMFTQVYMQNALLTGTTVAILAGLVGVFVVLRGVSFAAHALAQIGFAGAAGAVLIGVDPLWGLVAFAVGGALALSVLGTRAHERDATTALVLVAALGAGALFLALNSTFATAAFSLLFGSMVGISRAQVWATALLALGCVVTLAVLYRPLLFSSVSLVSAEARGVPIRLIGALFLLVVGVTTAVTVPTVGTLLIFSLMIGPAAAAVRLARRPATALLLSVVLSVAATWAGMVLAYGTGWPIGFYIAALATLEYGAARIMANHVPHRRDRTGRLYGAGTIGAASGERPMGQRQA